MSYRGYIGVVLTVLLSFLTSNVAYSEEECSYNPSAIDYKYFLKHTKFDKAKWNNKEKEARISIENSGDEVVVAYSACYELGVDARYLINTPPAKLDSEFYIEKLKWLGSKLLDESDYKLLLSALRDKSFVADLNNIRTKKRVFAGVEGGVYQSFLIAVVRDEGEWFVNISWAQ